MPIGGIAQTFAGGELRLTGCVAALDGSTVLRAALDGTIEEPAKLGNRLAQKFCDMGAEAILGELRQSLPNTISAP